MVFNLDNPQSLTRTLAEMGARHAEYGVKAEEFVVFGECLIDAIAYVSGPSWNETLQQAWIEAYDEVRQMMLDTQVRPVASDWPR